VAVITSAAALACLICNSACARPGAARQKGTDPSASEQQPPFYPGQYGDDAAVKDGTQPAVPPDSQSSTTLPFQAAVRYRVVPAGTLLTVQLDSSLTPEKARAGDPFSASVAGPVTIDGETVVQRGVFVSGRIESAQSAPRVPGLVTSREQGQGYLRLTLVAMVVDGKQIPLRTSSLFTRGSPRRAAVSSARNATGSQLALQNGHRLTFRLSAPLTLEEPGSLAVLEPAKESRPKE
jgi:hypothetical protein